MFKNFLQKKSSKISLFSNSILMYYFYYIFIIIIDLVYIIILVLSVLMMQIPIDLGGADADGFYDG